MEEEVGVKATRLRRRLSVETEDVKSPSVQTPTKKRGGRLAAKPQLELIDENAAEKDKPTRTRKSTIRNAEPEEKVVTPSRRSTRIRSNTSIVSETPGDTEDKGTPSRRNTRAKSNTSIVAEAIQHVDSPRAKRAARRLSQVGSDNEMPITPGRPTRRASKDFASSIDKQAALNPGKVETQIKEVIIEVDECNDRDTDKSTKNKNELSPSTRRSPRLIEKLEKVPSPDNNKENEISMDAKDTSDITNLKRKTIHNDSEKNNISISSSDLINQLSGKPKNQYTNLNKTTSALLRIQSKEKRLRTTSWTMVTSNSASDNNFLSDTEAIRKSNRKMSDVFNSGDNMFIDSKKTTPKSKIKRDVKDVSVNSYTLSETRNKTRSDNLITNGEKLLEETPNANKLNKLDKSTENSTSAASHKEEANFTEKFFGEAPTGQIQSLVYIEDSDSNTGIDTNNVIKEIDRGDQCVPLVDRQSNDQITQEPKNNLSYEPMDIDETMPENVTLSVFSDSKISTANDTGTQKSLKNISLYNSLTTDVFNNSQKKSDLEDDAKIVLKNSPSDKSKRSSFVVSNTDLNTSNLADNINDSLNKSKKKISTCVTADDDNNLNESANKFDIKSTNNDGNIHQASHKSHRESSITLADNDCSFINKSKINPNIIMKGSVNKRCSNVTENTSIADNSVDNCDKSNRKLSSRDSDDNSVLVKKSRKSSIINSYGNDSKSNDNVIKKCVKSEEISIALIAVKKNGVNDTQNDKSIEVSLKKDKSKRKSSISHTESQIFDKSNIENKSTLIISQIKNITEIGTPKDMSELNDSNESMEQCSKSKVRDNKLKHHSLTYSTSTPLQQKPLEKLGLQINSLPNSPNIERKNSSVKSKNKVSVLSQKDTTSKSSDEDENSEDEDQSGEDEEESIKDESSFENSKECSKDESMDNNELIEHEADEASDDYESGDSQDVEERKYEKENEIGEKGETLDSEDEEFSDDSEYEKGSFVVDSDEEDAELLNASGDDLSMSADELSMSAKSKRKFNERKMKEQKKASREMFEARHKLNEGKSKKKVNRQRLESSESESEISVSLPKKRHKRLRIDSSQDITMTDNLTFNHKKNTSKRLSESVREGNETNEKEMTIFENLETDKKDPLSLQYTIKEEPKTPCKELSVSAVSIMEDVENVDIRTNVSMVKSNQTSDPLEMTVVPDEVAENDSEESISENEEITENYESVLKDLNKHSNKVKSTDLSLNLNKKAKKNVKVPIVDQLNLTQIKKTKKTKEANKEPEKKLKDRLGTSKIFEKVNKSVNNQDEGSSDSIDLKLLFNEDSTDGEMKTTSDKNKKDIVEEVIPLTRTEGKTKMLETTYSNAVSEIKAKEQEKVQERAKTKNKTIPTQEPAENGSIKKNKKRKERDDDVGDKISKVVKQHYFDNVNVPRLKEKKDPLILQNTVKEEPKTPCKELSVSAVSIMEDVENVDIGTNVSMVKSNQTSDALEMTVVPDEVAENDSEESISENEEITENDESVLKDLNKHSNKVKSTDLSLNLNKKVKVPVVDQINLTEIKKSKKTKEQNKKPEKKLKDKLATSKIFKKVNKSVTNQDEGSSDSIDLKLLFNEDSTDGEMKTTSDKDKKDIVEKVIPLKRTEGKTNMLETTSHGKGDSNATGQFNKQENSFTAVDSNVVSEIKAKEQEKVQERAKTKNKTIPAQEPAENGFIKKSKKRKERDDDVGDKISKVVKQHYFDKVNVPRLPTSVLKELDEKPKKAESKQKLISTTSFQVEVTRQKRNKPSNYLEQSVYLNDSIEKTTNTTKQLFKPPKVLPFVPTASTSDFGFTTKFRVNVTPKETKFVAQCSDMANFKNDYLQKNRIKKLGTFEKYKRHRNIKISKF